MQGLTSFRRSAAAMSMHGVLEGLVVAVSRWNQGKLWRMFRTGASRFP